MDDQSNPCITFDVPRLRIGSSPVNVESVSLVKKDETHALMKISISRDLTVPLESFTFRYRFSTLPIDQFDSRHAWHDYVYTDPNMNSLSTLSFDASVPSRMKLGGCTAYVSQARLRTGEVIDFPPSGFTDEPEPVISFPTEPLSAPGIRYDTKKSSSDRAKRRKRSNRLVVGLTIFFFLLIIEVFGGIYLFNFTDLRSSVIKLIGEQRFNEAYKLAYDEEQSYLLQYLCEEAAAHFIEIGNYTEAYVYAAGAPERFTDEIIDKAAEMVVDPTSGELNEDAYRVAKMAADDGKLSEIVHSIITMLEGKEDFPNALRVASELRGDNDRLKTEESIFANAVGLYLSRHEFDKLISFLAELEFVDSYEVDDDKIADAIISYCTKSSDSSSLIYFSTLYPDTIDLTGVNISIKPDDNGIHAALPIIWPLLTTEQKRTYHSRDIAIYKEYFAINDGKISGTDIKDAVSIDTYEYHTVVLRENGSVTAIPNEGHNIKETFPVTDDVIQIAAGLSHTVMLHADGSVSAVGDNTYGQCDVSNWYDIAAVAAGQSFTLGLRVDGTLVATGSNTCGQCNVGSYRNVSAIAAGAQTSIMLFSDGKVGIQGYSSFGLEKLEALEGVTAIRAAGTGVCVKLKSGKFEVFHGTNSGSYGDPYNWLNIKSFDVGSFSIVALDAQGNLYSSGDGLPSTMK